MTVRPGSTARLPGPAAILERPLGTLACRSSGRKPDVRPTALRLRQVVVGQGPLEGRRELAEHELVRELHSHDEFEDAAFEVPSTRYPDSAAVPMGLLAEAESTCTAKVAAGALAAHKQPGLQTPVPRFAGG